MQSRSNVSPVPLTLDMDGAGIALQYLDGRTVEYDGPIEPREQSELHANTAYDIHVLVTDAEKTEGIIVYVNDFDTSDEILESTGVGRVLLEVGDEAAVYPGVMAARSQERITVRADPPAIDGAVYTFVENQLDERAYRIV